MTRIEQIIQIEDSFLVGNGVAKLCESASRLALSKTLRDFQGNTPRAGVPDCGGPPPLFNRAISIAGGESSESKRSIQ